MKPDSGYRDNDKPPSMVFITFEVYLTGMEKPVSSLLLHEPYVDFLHTYQLIRDVSSRLQHSYPGGTMCNGACFRASSISHVLYKIQASDSNITMNWHEKLNKYEQGIFRNGTIDPEFRS